MYRFIADDQANQIGGVGHLPPAGEVHRQPEAGVEEERFEKDAGDFFLQRFICLIVLQHQLRFALQRRVLFAPGIGGIDVFGLAERRENGAVGAGVHRLHKADVRQHRFLMRGEGVGHQRRGANGILDGIEQRQAGEDANR